MKSHEDVSAREGKDDKKKKRDGALDRARTDDLRLIRATRYQLRYESRALMKAAYNAHRLYNIVQPASWRALVTASPMPSAAPPPAGGPPLD